MESVSLFTPIIWTLAAFWWTYRYLTNPPQMLQLTGGELLMLLAFYAVAVYYWLEYVKSRKK